MSHDPLSPTPPPGLRERHRRDKLNRIADAAQRLFARDGYDRATLRAIAGEADVALATLGYYARDKRDLILLIFNRLLPPLIAEGLAAAAVVTSLEEQLLAVFAPVYRAYAGDVTLYRIVLGQIYGDRTSMHAARTTEIRAGLIDQLCRIVREAQARGECAAGVDPMIHARTFYFLNFGAVRVWLDRERPMAEDGLAELELLYSHHIIGMRG